VRAAIVDQDPAALVFLLEGLIPLARFVGDNPIRPLVAIGVLTDEEIDDYYSGGRQLLERSTGYPCASQRSMPPTTLAAREMPCWRAKRVANSLRPPR
jgi:hypothetical protein